MSQPKCESCERARAGILSFRVVGSVHKVNEKSSNVIGCKFYYCYI